ncbi:unnamed protein product [Dicrocoelium dendriticum]|nr:unnamed protein product [Dicrocoelium dendriticum]
MPNLGRASNMEELRRNRVLENLEQLKSLTSIVPEKEEIIKRSYGIVDKVRPRSQRKQSLDLRFCKPKTESAKEHEETAAANKKTFSTSRIKKSKIISLQYSDTEGEWLSSGEEWTPENDALDSKTRHTARRSCKPIQDSSSESLALRHRSAIGAVMAPAVSEQDRRYPFRMKKQPNYSVSVQIPEDDRFLYCYECGSSIADGCTKHPVDWVENRPLNVCEGTKDKLVLFQTQKCVCDRQYYLHTANTAPRDWVYVAPSAIPGAGFGVWCNRDIKCGTTFGPYDGEFVALDEIKEDEFARRSRGGYAWLVRSNIFGVKSHLIDARNPLRSNWLRFVNCARCDEEQNIVTIQYRGKIYYRACQDIPRGRELLTYYGAEFAAELELLADTPQNKIGLSDKRQQRDHTCEYCDKSFARKGNLQRHVTAIHLKQRHHTCEYCDKSFALKSDLQRHATAIHLKQRDHTCEYCDKSFTQKGNLQQHVTAVHLKQKAHICEYCDKSFALKGPLQRHVTAIHLKKSPEITGNGVIRTCKPKAHSGVPKHCT